MAGNEPHDDDTGDVAGIAGERQRQGDQPLRGGRGGAGSSYRRSDNRLMWPPCRGGRGRQQLRHQRVLTEAR